MILTGPVSCVSDDFPFYCLGLFLIRYIFYHRNNQICSMMSLTNLGLTPDPLVRTVLALFLCVLTSPFVSVSVFGSNIFSPT